MKCSLLLAIIASMLSCGRIIADDAAVSFKGRVTIEGPVPIVPKLKLKPSYQPIIPRTEEERRADEARKEAAPVVEVPDDSLVISDDRGIANVAIYLRKAPFNWMATAAPKEPVELRSADQRFQPHMALIRVGQPLRLIPSKDEGDVFHSHPRESNSFNVFVAQENRDIAKPFAKPEPYPTQIVSDVRPWRKAWLLALDHPFAAITDADGRFEIRDLPPGEHDFVVWHELPGYLNKDLIVQIEKGHVTEIDLKYTAKQLLPKALPR